MPFAANVLKVMISSPGDTSEEVDAVKAALHDWNADRAENSQTILLPVHWKTDAVPQLSPTGAQNVINSQLLDKADIVVALFDSRLGQATAQAASGTAEEIERANAAGKPVHVWFSNEPLGRDADMEQVARLKDFQKELESQGLYGVYQSPTDLAYKVRSAVERDIADLGLDTPAVPAKGGRAMPRARFEREERDGKTHVRLVLENLSDSVTAEGFTMELDPELRGMVFRDNTDPFDLHPHAPMRYVSMIHSGMPDQAKLRFAWTQNGEPQTLEQTISTI